MQGLTYNVDIVMCIDCTGSMNGILETVKSNALKFYGDLQASLDKKSKPIDTLRVKVVAYRDFYCDGEKSLLESDFFVLPGDESSFSNFVNRLTPDGGGDEPESGLEALALAMRAKWNKEGDKRREIIIVYTDASAHKLEISTEKKSAHYPIEMPTSFDEITDMWEGQGYMHSQAKRLIIFAPDAYPWSDISTHWEGTIHYPSKAGAGLSDVDYTTILDSISNSV